MHASLWVTMQQIGGSLAPQIRKLGEAGLQLTLAGANPGGSVDMHPPDGYEAIFERQDDWSSCSYFYLEHPENQLAPLADSSSRIAAL